MGTVEAGFDVEKIRPDFSSFGGAAAPGVQVSVCEYSVLNADTSNHICVVWGFNIHTHKQCQVAQLTGILYICQLLETQQFREL